ncbi:hypothetical protein KSP40_PGU010884 [Platanthera guangdongensis]|uniref:Pentatricopeptide repeat-containing protein n=1 Tax=Platanthera guangdongensis TaxID=2320717 RepID=A0ABR2LC63_9ASPA
MQSEKIKPCLITWNILIATYNQNEKPVMALDLMKEMKSRGVFPDVFTFTWSCNGS